jgi:hypothetical protein
MVACDDERWDVQALQQVASLPPRSFGRGGQLILFLFRNTNTAWSYPPRFLKFGPSRIIQVISIPVEQS